MMMLEMVVIKMTNQTLIGDIMMVGICSSCVIDKALSNQYKEEVHEREDW